MVRRRKKNSPLKLRVELFDFTFECLPTSVLAEFPVGDGTVYVDDMDSGVSTVLNQDTALAEWIDNEVPIERKKKKVVKPERRS